MREAVQLGSSSVVVVAVEVSVAVVVVSARTPGANKRAVKDAPSLSGVVFIVESVVASERG